MSEKTEFQYVSPELEALKFKVVDYAKDKDSLIARCEDIIRNILHKPITITIKSKDTGKEIYKVQLENIHPRMDIVIPI